jgi:hypothetical protein
MESPLAPIVANVYVEKFKQEALSTAKWKPTHWYRYVDDTFVVWPHGRKTLQDFLHLNGIHWNISSPWNLNKTEHYHFWMSW